MIWDDVRGRGEQVEMFRRSLPDGSPKHCLDRLSNRLTKILSKARRLSPLG